MSLQLGKPLKILKKIRETEDAVSLVLEVPQEFSNSFRYQAGQFVTFFMKINGNSVNRSYSLCTSPLVDKEFKVTIKKVPGGLGSTYLCDQVKVGDVLMTSPPAGTFFKPALNPTGTHYVFFAAGSGITPVMSIVKTVLSASKLNQVTLIFANRDQHSIIFANELATMSQSYAGRMAVHYVLSQPTSDWTGYRGRITSQILTEILGTHPSKDAVFQKERVFYLCGPTEFMSVAKNWLLDSGAEKDQIRQEDFGESVHKPHTPVGALVNEDWTVIGTTGESTTHEVPEKIEVLLDGNKIEVAAVPGQNILETLLEAGHQPPYSCMDGACMACLAKVVEGQTYQEDLGILTEDNIKNGEILTCQAKPLSKVLKISFDNL